MAKVASRYLVVHPWAVIEEGFHADHARESESIFSVANEFMGVRGYFDEGYSGARLQGSYINGVYEEKPIEHPFLLKGLATRSCIMVNTVDWLFTRLTVDGETLDLATSRVRDFVRRLDMQTGTMTRDFIWETASGKALRVSFARFTSMVASSLAYQRVTIEALNSAGTVQVQSGLDFSQPHEHMFGRNVWQCTRKAADAGTYAILAQTESSGLQAFSSFQLQTTAAIAPQVVEDDKYIGVTFELALAPGVPVTFDKLVANHAVKEPGVDPEQVWQDGMARAAEYHALSYEMAWQQHKAYWDDVWTRFDLTVEGDPETQQGVRFNIFHLHQTYHGNDPTLNIGPKGLTGEVYDGCTFWDTEAYCSQFFLFNNPTAAKNLIKYRHHQLPGALERAKQVDCKGAKFPFVTMDGTESCGLWHWGNTEIHIDAAVAYSIWHYVNISEDTEFLYREGIELLLLISRYYASRGGWNAQGEFGIMSVCGPDEFHCMVNNNSYTNFMARKAFAYTLQVIDEMQRSAPALLDTVRGKVALQPEEVAEWRRIVEHMRLPYAPESGLYEQHDGYFLLPHLDMETVPIEEIPLIRHWSFERLSWYDLIKQPDVLLFMFFHNQEFSRETKRKNYAYYEPRCSHESSLSPAVHSILAAELGLHEEAYKFWQFAARLDLDDYNRNTWEGLHVTAMGATWMNFIYGFGGLRSDGPVLAFQPYLPARWTAFSFRLQYRGSILSVTVSGAGATFAVVSGAAIPIKFFGQDYLIEGAGITLPIPAVHPEDALANA
ncbi:MAG TPA: glycosyl hydrolase family 65 protein [Armatimonadota bacterium]|jgi:maltose phosphorylase